MKYGFKDIENVDLYSISRVMFITGPHNLFNNIVVDELKEKCKGTNIDNIDLGLLDEFGLDNSDQISVSNVVDLDTFIKVVKMPSVNGKWFATVSLEVMTKKQLEWLKEYIKKPDENGVLAITSSEFKSYRLWLSNKVILESKEVNIIQLSFPNKLSLHGIVNKMFEDRGVRIEEAALDLFIVRMSDSYDDYGLIVEKICLHSIPDGYNKNDIENPSDRPVITYDMAFEALKGIENFVLDDFLAKVTVPLPSENVSNRNPVFRMMGYLVEEMGAEKLVKTLLRKIDELIEFRVHINSGNIPILVKYNVGESKDLIGDDPICKKSDFQFRKLASLASRTSILDWVYMKLILSNATVYNKDSYDRVLYSLITRSVLTESRLNNDIGIDDLNMYGLHFIDSIPYVDQVGMDASASEEVLCDE